MWNDITLTSQPSDVLRGDYKEGGGELEEVLLIAQLNIVPALSSDEREKMVYKRKCSDGIGRTDNWTSGRLIHPENNK